MPSAGPSPLFLRARWTVVLVAILVVAGTLVFAGFGAVPTVTGESTYTITVDGAVDVPERTVEFQGKEYQITAIAKADPGEKIDVSVDAPSGNDYSLYVYNADKQIEDQRSGTGDASFQFTLYEDQYEAGSYAIVLQHDGSNEKVHPLVVRGYAVTVDAPSEVTPNSTINVSVNATKLRGETLESVDVSVADDDQRVTTTADQESGSTYTATLSLDGLDEGTYDVFATVRGPDSAFGEDERLGLSDGSSLTIAAESTATPTDTATESSSSGGSSGGSGGSSGGSGSETATQTSVSTTTVGSTATTQPANRAVTQTSPPTSPPSDRAETTSPSTPDSNDETKTTTASDVITPRPTTGASTPGGTTSSATDGFGVLITLFAGLCGLGLWRRHRR